MTEYEGPDGWRLTVQGAAVHTETRTAVIADVHLGYEWARGHGGDRVPAHSLAETLAKLDCLLAHADINRLVVAGDLVESRRFCRRTEGDVARLSRWLRERGVTLVPLAGNHDRPAPARLDSLDVAGWTVAHGHRPIAASRTITGHLHPRFRGEGVSAPCFLFDESSIVLPAFSENAAGVNVETLTGLFRKRRGLQCVAVAGTEMLNFGPVSELFQMLRA